MRYGWLIPLALLVLTHATGLVALGVVTTDSMEPTMPPGSLFVAHRSDPDVGDIVVYTRPDGAQAVHRVVDVTDEGLITQGDANERTDQQAGIEPVNPSSVTTVPTVNGHPASIAPSWMKPIAILAGQALLLTYAIHTFLSRSRQTSAGWPWNRVRISHLILAAGFLLLAVAPFMHEELDASGQVEVQGLVLPTSARVTSLDTVEHRTLSPLETATLPAEGPVDVVRAPAVPGASALAEEGAVWAMLPTAIVSWAAGVWVRLEGH